MVMPGSGTSPPDDCVGCGSMDHVPMTTERQMLYPAFKVSYINCKHTCHFASISCSKQAEGTTSSSTKAETELQDKDIGTLKGADVGYYCHDN